MAKQKPRTLSGFMELLPVPQQQMERIMEILRNTYSLYGFTPLDTPIIESAEVLLAKGGGETEKQIYRCLLYTSYNGTSHLTSFHKYSNISPYAASQVLLQSSQYMRLMQFFSFHLYP